MLLLKMFCELNVELHFCNFAKTNFVELPKVVSLWELSLSLSTHLAGHGKSNFLFRDQTRLTIQLMYVDWLFPYNYCKKTRLLPSEVTPTKLSSELLTFLYY